MSLHQGFSLLELIITLAIAAILASLSYPVYTHHLQTARRKQAELTLMMIANQLETYHSIHNTYHGATLAHLAINTPGETLYQFLIAQENDQHYLLSATPLNAQKEDHCGTLKLNEINQQTAQQPSKSCW